MARTAASRAKATPRRTRCAVVLVDVINDLEFDGGDALLRHARPAARRIAALVARARAAGVPIIYANDNFGHWRSDLTATLRRCLEDDVRGREIAELLVPEEDDYFVLKPKHSAFFQTPLESLLRRLGARTLVLAGFAGDICVLFTAHDAHMREYRLFVPSDCSASENPRSNRWALRHIEDLLTADTRIGARIDFRRLRRARAG
jgi:nicotinamidase-related amidase